MIDQRALRQRRLMNEYQELMSIRGNVIQIEPLGNAPYEKYRITFNLRTVVSPAPAFRDKTVCLQSGWKENLGGGTRIIMAHILRKLF